MKKIALPLLIGTLENMAASDPRRIYKICNLAEDKAEEIENKLKQLSGEEKIKFIAGNAVEIFHWVMDEGMIGPIAAAFLAFDLINRLARRWLGDTEGVDDLSKSPPGNITSEMGLALGDGTPAVVGVQGAAKVIQDRQKIRVNGTRGYVEWIE